MASKSPVLNVMTAAALKVGRALVRDFGEVEQLQVSRKGPAEFVSLAEAKAENVARRELSRARPRFGFLMRAGGAVDGEDPSHRWIVAPLDGTTNFLHGIPHFAVSIGLERDGVMVAGVVYNPISDDMYWAELGQGAFLNDRRLRVSARENLHEALFATGITQPDPGDRAAFLSALGAVMAKVAGVRSFGCASLDLAYVAGGRCDGFGEAGLDAWNVAAGTMLVREAGGFVTDFKGRDAIFADREILAGNDRLHESLRKLLAQGSIDNEVADARAAGT